MKTAKLNNPLSLDYVREYLIAIVTAREKDYKLKDFLIHF